MALARIEQKVERYTLNIFRQGGYPITPRQRKAIEASRLVTSLTGVWIKRRVAAESSTTHALTRSER